MDEFCSLFSLVCSWLSLQGTSPRFGDGYCGASLHVKVRSPSITEDWTCSFYTIGSVRGKDILLPRSAVAQLDAGCRHRQHDAWIAAHLPVTCPCGIGFGCFSWEGERCTLATRNKIPCMRSSFCCKFAASLKRDLSNSSSYLLFKYTLHTHAEYSLNNCHDHRDVLAVLY